MRITFETENLEQAKRLLQALDTSKPPMGWAAAFAAHAAKPLGQPKRKHVVHIRHRRKCQLCKRGFLAKRTDAMYCGRPCRSNMIGTPKGRRLANKFAKPAAKPVEKPAKRKFTAKQLAAVRKNAAKARAALATKHRAAKRAEVKGTTLIKGDPLTPGLNP